jgi:hypothetical protein
MSDSLTDYCKNPSKYAKVYTQDNINLYNDICKLINGIDQIGFSIKELAGLIGNNIDGIADVLLRSMQNLIVGIFSPNGLKMLAEFKGVNLGIKYIYKILLKRATVLLSNGIMKDLLAGAINETVKESVAIACVNTAAICTVVTDDIVAFIAKESKILRFLAALGPIGEIAEIAQLIVQLVGLIFDTWDPCHYNDELDYIAVNNFTDAFNTAYRQSSMMAYNSFTDSYNNTGYLTIWPIEYTATRFLLDDYTSPEYITKNTKYTAQYLQSLKINSLGEPIYIPNGGMCVTDLDSSHFQKIANQLSLILAEGNTVSANFIKKYWPVFLILVFLFLIFIFFIIK